MLSFVNTEKYPPSALFLAMTLGPALIGLAIFEDAKGRLARVLIVFGRAPLFYYVAHLLLLQILAVLYAVILLGGIGELLRSLSEDPVTKPAGYGLGLPGIYALWALVVATLYLPCRWFAAVETAPDRRLAELSLMPRTFATGFGLTMDFEMNDPSADEIDRPPGARARTPRAGTTARRSATRPPDGGRGAVTVIYYLLRAGERSAWHRIDAVEIWHFYAGAPLELLIADAGRPEGGHPRHRLRRRDGRARRRPGLGLAERAEPRRLDPGRLHGGAGIRLQGLRAGAGRVDAALGDERQSKVGLPHVNEGRRARRNCG